MHRWRMYLKSSYDVVSCIERDDLWLLCSRLDLSSRDLLICAQASEHRSTFPSNMSDKKQISVAFVCLGNM